jgi:coenzyme F420-0:L-glutamate ligase/coenzyme F420-1:gamma-L-glutamate ligase
MSPLTLVPVEGVPLVEPGDDLAAVLIEALETQSLDLVRDDVVVVAQKVVSKAEGRYVTLASVTPGAEARRLAELTAKDPRLVEVILLESDEVVRHRDGLLITAHRHGWVVANAAVDQSNIDHAGGERVLLLPEAPDESATALRQRLEERYGCRIGVILNDSFGRAWRMGVAGAAIGASGVPALRRLVGRADLFGRELRVTEQAFADEVAAAASLLMGQADEAVPAVVVRGLDLDGPERPAAALVRPKAQDMFR